MSKIIFIKAKRALGITIGLLLVSGSVIAQEQLVTGSLSVSELSAGQTTELTVSYTATDASGDVATTPGLGLRMHYDSDVIELGDYSYRLFTGNQPFQIKDDVDDFDGNEKTDKFFLTSWAATSGGWPVDGNTGEPLAQPLDLYVVPLTARSGFEGSTLTFTAASTAAGYTLSADDVSVDKIPGTVATLESLSVAYTNQGTETNVDLTPSFDADIISYSAQVANPISMISMVPVVTDSFASISEYTANGSTVSDNKFEITAGSNEVIISVTSEDANNTTTYSVTIDRAEALSLELNTPVVMTNSNAGSYEIAGTCNLDDVSVVVSLSDGITSVSADSVVCADSSWSASVDATDLADGNITVSAQGTTALESDTAVATINKDTTGPTVSVPSNITVDAESAAGTSASNTAIVAFLQAATATDATDGSVSVTNNAPTEFEIGSTTVTFSAVDSLGNVGSDTATVTIEDQTAPMVTAPGAATVAATDTNGTLATDAAIVAFLAGASATDNVDLDLTITNNAPTTFPLGATEVIFSATDSSNLIGTATAMLTVTDQTAPVLVVPAAIIVDATDADGTAASNATIAAFLSGATATDNVDTNISVTNDGLSLFPLGSTAVSFTASDAAGNESTATVTITVADQTGPVISVPSNTTVAATDGSGTLASDPDIIAFLAGASAVDNVDIDVVVENNAPDSFGLGSTTVNFTATDAAGNSSTASAVITVADITAPVIDAPATFVVLGTEDGVQATEQIIVDFLASITATDNVDGVLSSVSNDGPELYPFGTTTVTFSVSDSAGNEGTAQSVVNISLDIIDPQLSVPDSISLNVDMPSDVVAASDDAIVNFLSAASATDNKDGDLTSSITDDAPEEFEVGETSVTFSVSDAAGNAVSGSANVTVVVLDTDQDGLPDFYEEQNGLDLNDPSDADGDLDGDGVSNLDEYLDGTDPTKDELPPELSLPEDISAAATGRLTDITLNSATANDNKDGPLTVNASATGPFESGLTEITWSVSDAAGNESSGIQRVEIVPLVNLTPSTIATEGSTVEIKVELSGPPVAYPVSIPLAVGGTATADDYNVAGEIIISEGTIGSIMMEIASDEEFEGTETVVITLGTPEQAVPGSVSERIISIVEENVAPTVNVVIYQGNTTGRIVAADQGTVWIQPEVDDMNSGDAYTIDWTSALAELPSAVLVVDADVVNGISFQALEFDPSTLSDTIVNTQVSVTDNGNPALTTVASVTVKVLAVAPDLGNSDSDGDGISDTQEGYGDSDNDGIPDYQDNIVESYLAPIGDDGQIAQSAVGTSIVLGDTALATGDNTLSINEGNVGTADADYDYAGGLVDFTVSGAQAGSSYNVVLPLGDAIPADAVLRKFMGDTIGWQQFVEDANNAISSATAASGTCPEAGSNRYEIGLVAGATCVQLYLEDGGPNDMDGAADGTVTDPSGIASLYFGPPSTESTITISVAELTAGGSETAVVTVTAVDADGRSLEGMSISASTSLSDATVSSFTEGAGGVYTATLTPGSTGGDLSVTAIISNGSNSVSITSANIVVKKSGGGGGGCTVGDGQSTDWSLMLLLLAGLMLMFRRRFLIQ